MSTLASIETLTLVRPETPEAKTWLEERAPYGSTWIGGALVVEPRSLDDILRGLRDALGPSMDPPRVMT